MSIRCSTSIGRLEHRRAIGEGAKETHTTYVCHKKPMAYLATAKTKIETIIMEALLC